MDTDLLNKTDWILWLANRGLSTTGTLQELQMRINRLHLYPSLAEKLRIKREKNFSFGTSLNPVEIPPITAPWGTHENMYPAVSSTSFKEYATRKREGSLGQQQKAYSMLTSRKIVSVKTHKNSESNIFIRALIKKSYGEQIRPAVLLVESPVPSKGYCECPVGVSGLCCHALALLLFLKHFTETKETILAPTCTEQIQK